jgi:hypothetical protein
MASHLIGKAANNNKNNNKTKKAKQLKIKNNSEFQKLTSLIQTMLLEQQAATDTYFQNFISIFRFLIKGSKNFWGGAPVRGRRDFTYDTLQKLSISAAASRRHGRNKPVVARSMERERPNI